MRGCFYSHLRWPVPPSILLIVPLFFSSPCRSEELPPPVQEGEASLERLIQDYETVEREIGKAKQALKETATTASERRRIEAWIREMERRQQELVDAIERKAGPLPPEVRDETLLPPEKRVDSQRLRDEAILEKDVSRKLP